jgi:hypothetical protein
MALHDPGQVALDSGEELVAFGQGLVGDEDVAQVVGGLRVAAIPAAGQRLQVPVKHFGNLEKGIAGFAELKDILQQDPSKIADPAVRAQAEAQIRTALNGAKKDIDKVFADVIETIGTVLVLVEFVLIMVHLTLTLAQLVGDPGFQKAANGVRTGLEGIGKDLDRINAGLATMGGALDDMNGAVDEINSSLGQMNRGIAQANRGMDKRNQGLADSNKAVKNVNKHIPGIKKTAAKLRGLPGIEYDFSHIGDTWSSGTSGLSTAERPPGRVRQLRERRRHDHGQPGCRHHVGEHRPPALDQPGAPRKHRPCSEGDGAVPAAAVEPCGKTREVGLRASDEAAGRPSRSSTSSSWTGTARPPTANPPRGRRSPRCNSSPANATSPSW